MHQNGAASTLQIDGVEIAYTHQSGAHAKAPCVYFLPGFRSNMAGTKALYLRETARARGWAFVSLDYRGHGLSGGDFEQSHIERWRLDASAVFDATVTGPCYLVGSSMGAWIAVRMALADPARVQGVVTVAAAPDFTEDVLLPRLSDDHRAALVRGETVYLPSDYDDEPYPVSATLISQSRDALVLREAIALDCPLRAIHGAEDVDVPVAQSEKLIDRWRGRDTELQLIRDGDHRLSRDSDLAVLVETLVTLVRSQSDPA